MPVNKSKLVEHTKTHLSVGGEASPIIGNGPVYPLPFLEHNRSGEHASQSGPKQALLQNRIRAKSIIRPTIYRSSNLIDQFDYAKKYKKKKRKSRHRFSGLPELECWSCWIRSLARFSWGFAELRRGGRGRGRGRLGGWEVRPRARAWAWIERFLHRVRPKTFL